MKNLSTLFLILLIPLTHQAQVRMIGKAVIEIPFELSVKGGQPDINWEPSRQVVTSIPADLVMVTGLELEDADLIVNYRLGVQNRGFYFNVRLALHLEGEVREPEPWNQKGDMATVRLPLQSGEAVWANALEHVLDFGRPCTLILEAELWGDPLIDCAEMPTFSFNEQWPHYLGAVVGIGLIGLGEATYRIGKNDYDEYRDIWLNGGSRRDADPKHDSAKDFEKISKITTWSGIAVLGVNTGWYILRLVKHNKRKKNYKKYCHQEKDLFGITPVYYPSINPSGQGQIGCRISLDF